MVTVAAREEDDEEVVVEGCFVGADGDAAEEDGFDDVDAEVPDAGAGALGDAAVVPWNEGAAGSARAVALRVASRGDVVDDVIGDAVEPGFTDSGISGRP